MGSVAIIGGSGFEKFDAIGAQEVIVRETPYGAHSGPVITGRIGNAACVFLPRHSEGHRLPPHKINYRANLWLLKQLGVSRIIACNVVGGITPQMSPDTFVVPHQIIDYTYGREPTFYDGSQDKSGEHFDHSQHIDFTHPYASELRERVMAFLRREGLSFVDYGVYGCTQGPRLETAAEIERLKRDGCDIVGMTGMPEAALAKELGIEYASIAVVVNWAAGVTHENLSMVEILNTVKKNMHSLARLLPNLLRFL